MAHEQVDVERVQSLDQGSQCFDEMRTKLTRIVSSLHGIMLKCGREPDGQDFVLEKPVPSRASQTWRISGLKKGRPVIEYYDNWLRDADRANKESSLTFQFPRQDQERGRCPNYLLARVVDDLPNLLALVRKHYPAIESHCQELVDYEEAAQRFRGEAVDPSYADRFRGDMANIVQLRKKRDDYGAYLGWIVQMLQDGAIFPHPDQTNRPEVNAYGFAVFKPKNGGEWVIEGSNPANAYLCWTVESRYGRASAIVGRDGWVSAPTMEMAACLDGCVPVLVEMLKRDYWWLSMRMGDLQHHLRNNT